MNGMEAWSIVAPILAAHGGTNPDGLDCIDEAYVTVYGALKYWDEQKGKRKDGNEGEF